MHRDDLDKMLALVEKVRQHGDWEDLAEYLSLHGRGIRKPALAVLDRFVVQAKHWPFARRLELALWCLEILGNHRMAAALRGLVCAAIREWPRHEAETARMHLWLGELNVEGLSPDGRVAHFRRALELDPDCDDARKHLSMIGVDHVHDNQHTLPGFYRNSPEADLLDLAEAEALWGGREHSIAGAWCLQEIGEYRARAEEWLRRASDRLESRR